MGRLLLGAGATALLLAGCEQSADGAGGSLLAGPGEVGRSVQIVERDVEAPEVFQITDMGLWDGRPSLGGVWIAHSEVDDPERVIIRNETSGEFVIGALFRRERQNPGPRLQVSSDAAAALGMLAGQPVALNVTALRRQEAEPAAPPAAAEPEPPVAVAAAPAGADATAAEDREPAPTVATAAADGPGAGAPAGTATGETAGEPPRRGFLAGLFTRRTPARKPEAEIPEGLISADIETRPIADIAATAASALDRAETGPAEPAGARTVAARPAAAPAGTGAVTTPAAAQSTAQSAAPSAAPSAAQSAATAAARPASGLDRPFVQIGIFSVEANATRAAGMLRADGLAPTVRREEHRGQASWRVVAGPAATGADRDRLIAAVRRLGFDDAYAVRR